MGGVGWVSNPGTGDQAGCRISILGDIKTQVDKAPALINPVVNRGLDHKAPEVPSNQNYSTILWFQMAIARLDWNGFALEKCIQREG